MKLTESDRRAFDIWWARADERNPDGVDEFVREKCAELERQFVFDQEDGWDSKS